MKSSNSLFFKCLSIFDHCIVFLFFFIVWVSRALHSVPFVAFCLAVFNAWTNSVCTSFSFLFLCAPAHSFVKWHSVHWPKHITLALRHSYCWTQPSGKNGKNFLKMACFGWLRSSLWGNMLFELNWIWIARANGMLNWLAFECLL